MMIDKKGYKCRNIQEQVAKNTYDIIELKSLIPAVKYVSTITSSGNTITWKHNDDTGGSFTPDVDKEYVDAYYYELRADINDISNVIDPTASSTDKLIPESKIDEKISNMDARHLYKNASQGNFSTKAELTSAFIFYDASGDSVIPTLNDVAYVISDETHEYKLSKYHVAEIDPLVWGFDIAISNITFTQAQLDAINSGVTANLLEQMQIDIGNKQEKLSVAFNTVTGSQAGSGFGTPSISYSIQVDLGQVYLYFIRLQIQCTSGFNNDFFQICRLNNILGYEPSSSAYVATAPFIEVSGSTNYNARVILRSVNGTSHTADLHIAHLLSTMANKTFMCNLVFATKKNNN